MAASVTRLALDFIPGDVLKVMERIHSAGSDVWVVGGALRDYLLGIEPKDWDLATSAGSSNIISLFPRVIPVGIRHGTVQVHTRTRDIEVTSFDLPGEAGMMEDLGRRDFTINSLALSYPGGIIMDPHGGKEDLKAGVIRAVGNPGQRFSEDPLRIVRAARISGIYGFRVDRPTFDAMREGAMKLAGVSGERIRDEILKILMAPNAAEAFELLRSSGALALLLPGIDACAGIETRAGSGVNLYEHTIACILNCPERTRVRLAALFHEIAAPAFSQRSPGQQADSRRESARTSMEIMKRWNISNSIIDEVSTLIRRQIGPDALSWNGAQIRRFIVTVRPELLEDFIALAEAEQLSGGYEKVSEEEIKRFGDGLRTQLGRISAFSVRELALGGDEVMKILQIEPGPQVGRILKHLFDAVQVDPDLNTREHLIRIVAEKYRDRNG
jgi:tRNA nucleotidyltransferase/poly(A) polymerase